MSKYGKYTKGKFVVACFSPGFSNDIFVIDGYDLFGPVLCYSNLKKKKIMLRVITWSSMIEV